MGKTLFQKVWDDHVVRSAPGEPTLLYIDLHLVHEVTSPQAFEGLRIAGRKVRRPDRTFATMDHNVPTTDRSLPIVDPISKTQIETLSKNCRDFGVTLFDLKSVEPSGRIRAVIGWSQGLSGEGTLVGTVSENTMDLSGTILSQETGIWDCDLKMTFTSDSSIRGTYRLFPRPGNPFGTQDGEFTLDRIR